MMPVDNPLPGRAEAMPVSAPHRLLGRALQPPFPAGHLDLWLGMGCFWGAERRFWSLPGVWVTAVGYAGGQTPNPSYEEVCSGRTGHAEVVRLVFDPKQLPLADVLRLFWESHDPTQGMRQGNDIGSQYRSALYLPDTGTLAEALASRAHYQAKLQAAGYGAITSEIALATQFYYAESYHQQYLDRHPNGYCGLAGTGVRWD